jgi:hypothetical protein
MAGITELKSMLSDNHEATEILNSVEQTLMQSTGRITDLEKQVGSSASKLGEAIESRDKVRQTIKDELGISEFTADAVRAKLSSYASDDVIAARDEQFSTFKAASSAKMEELEGRLQGKDSEMKDLMLKLAISKTDVMGQTKGEHATDMLLQWIAKDAVFDANGNIMYQGEAGEPLYNANGNPLTLEDRIGEIKSDQGRDFVFQARFLNGGGAPTEKTITGPAGSSSGGAYVRSQMSFTEKKDYRAKYGDAAYNSLPLA